MAALDIRLKHSAMLGIHVMISKYLAARYKDGARGDVTRDGRLLLDCWGLVRMARVELYARKLLSSRGGEYRFDPAGFTRNFNEQSAKMRLVAEPVAGAVIAVMRKKYICEHVALVVHDINRSGLGLHVLEINPDQNTKLWPLYRFLQANELRTILYYDDQDLPEQT